MKTARILTAAALAIVVAAAAFAGGARESAPKAAEAKPLRIAVVMPSSTTDMAFSQSMWTALKSIQAKMGGEAALKLVYSENMFVLPDASSAIRDYASQGYDIVFAHGSQYGSLVQEIAPDFPETVFAWGTDVKTFGIKNLYAYTAAAEEGGYVNGVLAGHLSKSGKIGVTGPIEVGDAKTYIDGFVAGVNSAQKGSSVSKTWTGSFSDVALMTAAARTHIANGADILTGSSQSVVGSIGVAKEAGKVLWFGTQAEQSALAPQLVVASQVYDWSGMVEEIIANRKAGKLGGQAYVLTLANGGLKIAFNPAYPLPAAAKKAAEDAIAGIKSGSIKPLR